MNNWGPAIVVLIVIGVLNGVHYLFIAAMLDDLRNRIDDSFMDLRILIRSEVKRLEERIDHTRA